MLRASLHNRRCRTYHHPHHRHRHTRRFCHGWRICFSGGFWWEEYEYEGQAYRVQPDPPVNGGAFVDVDAGAAKIVANARIFVPSWVDKEGYTVVAGFDIEKQGPGWHDVLFYARVCLLLRKHGALFVYYCEAGTQEFLSTHLIAAHRIRTLSYGAPHKWHITRRENNFIYMCVEEPVPRTAKPSFRSLRDNDWWVVSDGGNELEQVDVFLRELTASFHTFNPETVSELAELKRDDDLLVDFKSGADSKWVGALAIKGTDLLSVFEIVPGSNDEGVELELDQTTKEWVSLDEAYRFAPFGKYSTPADENELRFSPPDKTWAVGAKVDVLPFRSGWQNAEVTEYVEMASGAQILCACANGETHYFNTEDKGAVAPHNTKFQMPNVRPVEGVVEPKGAYPVLR